MVNTRDDVWIHACQLDLLVDDTEQYDYAADLLCVDARSPPCFPGGRLLPTRLQLAAQRCAPDAAAVGFHPIQLNDVWSSGALDDQYESRACLRLRRPDADTAQRWIDDIYKPHSRAWWEAAVCQYHASPDPAKKIWAACYDETPGWTLMTESACVWYVVIPCGAIRMRSSQAVVQSAPAARSQLLARNPRTIYIGVLSPSMSHDEAHRARHSWRDALQHEYEPEWMTLEHLHRARRGAGDLHGLALWSPSVSTAFPDPGQSPSRTWLHEQFPGIYDASSGWRTWPSASPTTAAWALSLSTSRRRGATLHTGILRAIWDANHTHWTRTCSADHTAISAAGDSAALEEANDHISRGVRAHQHFNSGLDTQLASAAARQVQRTAAWHRAVD